MTWLEILAQCAWRGTIVLAAAFAAAPLFGRGPRRSAALRHFIWTAAFAALLSLRLAVAGLARWQWTATAAPAGPPERLRIVLLHEMLHIQRRDLLAQAVAQLACCLYWFHPLVWIAARQLRKERERACDDAVLTRGVAASEYAGHLLDLVRAAAAKRSAWADAPAMAESSGLES